MPGLPLELDELLLDDELLLEELLEELELLDDEELELLEDEPQEFTTPPLPPWLSQVCRPIQLWLFSQPHPLAF